MSDMTERVAEALAWEERRDIWPNDWSKAGELKFRSNARAAIRAHKEALAEAGYVIVPREPTEEMIDEGWVALINGRGGNPWAPHRCWQAMCNTALGEDAATTKSN